MVFKVTLSPHGLSKCLLPSYLVWSFMYLKMWILNCERKIGCALSFCVNMLHRKDENIQVNKAEDINKSGRFGQVSMCVPMGTYSCCQQKSWERLQTLPVIQAQNKFVKKSKYTWIISSFINHSHYYQVKSCPRVTRKTPEMFALK